MSKTTPSRIVTSSVLNRTVFITIDSGTYKQLVTNSLSAVHLELSKGLQGWTKGQGTDLDGFKNLFNGEEYVLLLDSADQASAKGRLFISAMREMMTNLNKKFFVPAMTPGVTTDVLVYEKHYILEDQAKTTEGYAEEVEAEEEEKTEESADGPKVVLTSQGGVDATNTGANVLDYIFAPCLDAKTNKMYLVPRATAPEYLGRRAYSLGADDARQALAHAYHLVTGEVLPRNAQGSIEDLAAGKAKASGTRITTVSRTYQDSHGAVWIDLGRDDCKCVRITPEGWTIEDMPANGERVFIKDQAVREIGTDPVAPKDVPEAMGTLNRILRPLFNVNEEDWHLIIGWMVNHLLAERVSPILMMLGTGGSGKSTMCNAISYAVEGGPTFPRSGAMKNDVDDVMVTIAKKRVSVFDNVSKLSGELSDTLAQAVYGMDYEKRELRTTDSVAVIKVNPSLILNGITTGHLREDLKSRMVTIRIAGTVPTDRQKDDLEIVREQTQGHPEVYGALLTLTSAVMRMLADQEEIHVEARMKEYARVLHALDDLLGWDSLEHYVTSVNETAEDALEDPLLTTVVYLVRKNGRMLENGSWVSYVGTSQLVGEMMTGASTLVARASGDDQVSISARQVPDRFSRVQGDWKKLGVIINISGKLSGTSRPRIDGVRQSAYEVTVTPQAKSLLDDAEMILASQRAR